MATKKKKLFKKVRLKTIFLLALTLASNSFAWFIYSTEVSSSISTRVREWKVTFDADGENIEKDKKSIAYSLTFSDNSKTLTDDEVLGIFNKIISDIEKSLGAEIRK